MRGSLALSLLVCVLVSALACNSDTGSTTANPTQPSQCRDVTTQVFANQFWQDTGVFIRAGNLVRTAAIGSWGDSTGITDGNGRGSQPVTGPGDIVPLPGSSIMRLIGRIGNGPPFAAGVANAWTSNATGNLFLTPNDRSDSLSDNFGSLTVLVTVCP